MGIDIGMCIGIGNGIATGTGTAIDIGIGMVYVGNLIWLRPTTTPPTSGTQIQKSQKIELHVAQLEAKSDSMWLQTYLKVLQNLI